MASSLRSLARDVPTNRLRPRLVQAQSAVVGATAMTAFTVISHAKSQVKSPHFRWQKHCYMKPTEHSWSWRPLSRCWSHVPPEVLRRVPFPTHKLRPLRRQVRTNQPMVLQETRVIVRRAHWRGDALGTCGGAQPASSSHRNLPLHRVSLKVLTVDQRNNIVILFPGKNFPSLENAKLQDGRSAMQIRVAMIRWNMHRDGVKARGDKIRMGLFL